MRYIGRHNVELRLEYNMRDKEFKGIWSIGNKSWGKYGFKFDVKNNSVSKQNQLQRQGYVQLEVGNDGGI